MAKHERKSLTQRVADRKRGVPDDPRDYGKKSSKYGPYYLFGMVLQGVGLIVLMLLMGQYVRSGYEDINWVMVAVSSGAFIVGRVLTSIKKFLS